MNLKDFIKRGTLHESTGYVCRCMLLIHHCLGQHRTDVSYALQVSMALTQADEVILYLLYLLTDSILALLSMFTTVL